MITGYKLLAIVVSLVSRLSIVSHIQKVKLVIYEILVNILIASLADSLTIIGLLLDFCTGFVSPSLITTVGLTTTSFLIWVY